MSDSELPPDLRQLEAELQARPRPDASTEHRARVLSAVRRERANGAADTRNIWRFAAGIAAALMLGINLSMSAVNDTPARLSLRHGADETQASLAQLRQALPELSDEEALRQVLLLRARSQLVQTPLVRGAVQSGAAGGI